MYLSDFAHLFIFFVCNLFFVFTFFLFFQFSLPNDIVDIYGIKYLCVWSVWEVNLPGGVWVAMELEDMPTIALLLSITFLTHHFLSYFTLPHTLTDASLTASYTAHLLTTTFLTGLYLTLPTTSHTAHFVTYCITDYCLTATHCLITEHCLIY